MMGVMTTPIELLQSKAKPCDRCHREALLHAEGSHRAYPVFQRDPPWPVRVLAVLEAPNATDSFDPDKGRLTVDAETDPTGRFLRELFASVGLRAEEVLFTNSVLCLPARDGGGKHPVSARQQDQCADWLGQFIETADPAVVVTFGAVALQGVGRLERHGLSLHESAGKLHPWRNRHLLPLYHPGRLGRVTRPEEEQRKDIAVLRDVLARVSAPRPRVIRGD
jgi:uracil-DNA glycosylase family 4